MFTVDVDGTYRLPMTRRFGPWSAYVGAGAAFSLVGESFERVDGGRDFDWGDFNFKAGLNILAGVQFRHGLFMEAKTTVYSVPHLRLKFGYVF